MSVRRLVVAGRSGARLGPVDFDLEAGATLAVLGPSGSGKSTLLRGLVGLWPEGAAVRGEIWLGGLRVGADVTPAEVRRRVGLLRQRPVAFPGTVADNVRVVLRSATARHGDDEVAACLDRAGVPRRLWGRPAGTLSGGELQRLALARLLARSPGVLLLDEPTAALDPMAARAVEERLRSLSPEVTVLWVTHSVAQARRVARSWLVLWEGRTLALGTPEALLEEKDPRLRALCAEILPEADETGRGPGLTPRRPAEPPPRGGGPPARLPGA